MNTADEIGTGTLSRMTAAIYRYLVLGVFLAVAGVPTLLVWSVLSPDGSNTALFVAALLPTAPALSGALYALRAWSIEPDLSPMRPLLRGLRLNLRDTLLWWVPVLALATVLTVNLVFAGKVPGGEALRPVSAVLMVALAVWAGHLLVATSFFSFRLRDALRVAAAECFLAWRTSLGFLSLLLIAAVSVALTSELVLLPTAWLFAAFLWTAAQPAIADITERFIRKDTREDDLVRHRGDVLRS